MVSVNFLNEKGNISVKVRNGLRKQIFEKVFETLAEDESLEKVFKNANGGFSIPLAEDSVTGDVIYANFELTVSTKNPMDKVVRKKKGAAETAKVEVEVPNLFGWENKNKK